MSDVTRILERVQQGDPTAAAELMPLVYEELRRLAAYRMSQQPLGQTLQPTALVHEAYLRLAASPDPHWEHRAHFFAAAAEAMRHILVDQARRKLRAKHGAGASHVDVHSIEIAAPTADDKLLLIHEALDAFITEDPTKAQVVKLHVFVGLTHDEIARALSLSEKTVRRHWNFARVRLYQIISGNSR